MIRRMKIKPLSDRVLVEPILEDETVEGGIHMPMIVRTRFKKGKVIAVGEGTETQKMIVKPDEIVVFAEGAGSPFSLSGKNYIMFGQRDLLAILE